MARDTYLYLNIFFFAKLIHAGAPQLSLTKYFCNHFSRVSLTFFWLGYLDVAIAKKLQNCMYANL